MQTLLTVALGGALGALGRYGAVGLINEVLGKHFPYATLAVNVLGSFLIGVAYVFVIEKFHTLPEFRALVMVGFLGAFTTFSTFSLETVGLLEEGRVMAAGAYILSSVILCVMATFTGIMIAKPMIS